MTAVRRLIVNADDFGLCGGVNAGVIAAHERGIVTSASLMVLGEAAREAVSYARSNPGLDLGLHVDLAEWRHGGRGWAPVYERVARDDTGAVAREIERQMNMFIAMVGRPPTHIDSHQHVHLEHPVDAIVAAWAQRLDIATRSVGTEIRYEGGFYGQSGKGEPWPAGITPQNLCRLVRELPDGITEIGCHPGMGDAAGSGYGAERSVETTTLGNPVVAATIKEEGIELTTFDEARRTPRKVA